MLGLPDDLGRDAARPLRLVALGAHADDVEIGAGGTVLRLLAERPHTHVEWLVATGDAARAAEARAAAAAFCAPAVSLRVTVPGLRDGLLPHDAEALRDALQDIQKRGAPDLVLAHRLADAHQDHRAVAEAAWQVFRGARIAAYEIPKWEGDLGGANAYVTLDAALAARKLDLLAAHFPSQHGKPWYARGTFEGLLRLRGVEAAAPFAEAFECRKLVW